jgi:hypothetical protein
MLSSMVLMPMMIKTMPTTAASSVNLAFVVTLVCVASAILEPFLFGTHSSTGWLKKKKRNKLKSTPLKSQNRPILAANA